MVDHVLLRLCDVLQVDDDDVLEVSHPVVLEQLHLNLEENHLFDCHKQRNISTETLITSEIF